MPFSPLACVLPFVFASVFTAALSSQHAIRPGAARPAAAARATRPVLAIGTVQAPRAALAATRPETAAAIDRALRWLLARQQENGRWDCDAGEGGGSAVHDVAVTGLALLALSREGTAGRDDPRREPILRGVHWLALQQQENGMLGTAASHDFVYDHAIATMGLAAAAAATGSAEATEAVRGGIAYLERHRNPYSVWRYQPRDNDNDSSVTTWATLGCLAARELGLTVADAALGCASIWFDQVTGDDGRAGYTRAGQPSSRRVDNANRFPPEHGEAMTGAALWCRQALGEDVTPDSKLAAGVALLLAKPPVWQPDAGKVDLCYWFFAAEALRRVGDEARAGWFDALQQALRQGQRDDGAWDAVDPWGHDGGRLYSTALAVLALQALYDLPALRGAANPPPADAPDAKHK
jgi:hypothetical protein